MYISRFLSALCRDMYYVAGIRMFECFLNLQGYVYFTAFECTWTGSTSFVWKVAYLCMYACMYVRVRMYACMHVCVCVCVYVCMYVCLYVCMRLSALGPDRLHSYGR